MFDKAHTLNVSQTDLAVIEAALHTQSKILDVQANAGGSEARDRLNEVKHVLANLSHQKPVVKKPCNVRRLRCWLGMTRKMG